jgi:hypothetical protein
MASVTQGLVAGDKNNKGYNMIEKIDDEMEPSRKKPLVLQFEESENTLKVDNYETDTDPSTSTDGDTDDKNTSGVEELFQKARHMLCPSTFYRHITYLYAERKLVVFFLVHFVSTLIIWCECSISLCVLLYQLFHLTPTFFIFDATCSPLCP